MRQRGWMHWALGVVLALSGWAALAQPREVRVGAYPFLPFWDGQTGLTADLVRALNAFQKDYRFVLVPTSSARRYRDLEDGQYSVIFFENARWGWSERAVDATHVYLRGDGEVYVARAQPGRDQTYFDTVADKDLLGVTGYHYAFAGMEGDPALLRQRFRITFGQDNAALLRHLLAGHGEIAVLTKSFVTRHLQQRPQDALRLLISERYDQLYEHSALVARGSAPSARELDALLDRMEAAGVLRRLWAAYGMGPSSHPPRQ
ncbi:MAG: substrate-binding periplasmic protein [Rhodoferax sp.]